MTMQSKQRFDPALVRAATSQLEAFANSNAGVLLTVLTSSDGFEVAAYPADNATAARIAAMSSSIQALSEALTREAGLSTSRSLILETDTGTVVVVGLAETSPKMSLAVVATGSELLGKLLWATRNLCKALESSLRQ
jgi:predicted regulator of Ras-like GTPase activity (Roadblock/LC7/MglB family)